MAGRSTTPTPALGCSGPRPTRPGSPGEPTRGRRYRQCRPGPRAQRHSRHPGGQAAKAPPPAPSRPGLGVGWAWRSGPCPLGAHSRGTGRRESPRTSWSPGSAPPTRPDVWKLPEGHLDLATTPGPTCPPSHHRCPAAAARQPRAPNVLKDVLRSPDLHGAGGLRGVRAAQRGKEATQAPAPPPRHPAGPAARTRLRARRRGRPDALARALSRPGFGPRLARGATKPRPLAPGAPRRRSSGGSICRRRRGRSAAQARHAAAGPPPRGRRGES